VSVAFGNELCISRRWTRQDASSLSGGEPKALAAGESVVLQPGPPRSRSKERPARGRLPTVAFLPVPSCQALVFTAG